MSIKVFVYFITSGKVLGLIPGASMNTNGNGS